MLRRALYAEGALARSRRRLILKSKKTDIKSYLFLLPAFIIFSSVVIAPTIYSFYLSFFSWNGIGEKTFVALDNYLNLFLEDAVFLTALKNNFVWILLTMVFTVSLSLMLAVILNRSFKGRVVYRAIFYVPYMLSWVVVGVIWKWMYNPNMGFINEFLKVIGLGNLKVAWLSEPKIALYCVYFAALWQGIGQPMILFLSGLQTIAGDVLEAATIDGAGKVKPFIHITVPILKETFVVVFATLIIAAMKVYDIIKVMTGGGPGNATETLATYMYSQTFMYNNFGKGSAIASAMFLMMIFIIVPYVIYTAKED